MSGRSPLISDGLRHRSRVRAPLTVALVLPLLVLLPSCVTPVASGPRHRAIGLFQSRSRRVRPEVEYSEVRGVGVAMIEGRLSLGYVHWRCVEAAVDRRSYRVATPLADFAVGAAAESAGLDFIQNADGGFDRR